MFRRLSLRPSLEPLEPRQLMAADLPLLGRLAAGQQVAGPIEFGKAAVEYTAPASAGEVTHPEWNAVTGNVIGDAFYNYSNMTVEVVEGVLRIRGDFGRNYFRMFGGDGSYRIEPYLTKINGQVWTAEHGPFHFSGITGGIDIDLGAGDDELTFEVTSTPGLTIRMGTGNDKVTLRGPDNRQFRSPSYGGEVMGMALIAVPVEAIPLAITGNVFIDTGAGDDWIAGYAKATGDVTVQMGDGDDNFVEGPLENEFWRPRTSRAITADGVRTIDLGAGQDVDNIPDNIDYDFELWGKMSWVGAFFPYYRGLVERGENTPGVPQLVRYIPYDNPVRVDGEGRVEVEILFTAGLGRVVDRLIARGVTIDAYTVLGGGARARISEQDLRLFANLPGLMRIQPVTYVREELRPPMFRWELPWDYVRPGSVPAEEEARWGPRTPVTNPPDPPLPEPTPPTNPGIVIIAINPLIGPARFEEIQSEINVSLLHSYYGVKLIGPRSLDP